jgi:hypothetical protein
MPPIVTKSIKPMPFLKLLKSMSNAEVTTSNHLFHCSSTCIITKNDHKPRKGLVKKKNPDMKHNRSINTVIVGSTEHVRFVQQLPDLFCPGSFDFNGMHIKQFTVPAQKWYWPMRLKGCLRVLHIGIDPYTRRGLIHTILHGKLTRSTKPAITARKIHKWA